MKKTAPHLSKWKSLLNCLYQSNLKICNNLSGSEVKTYISSLDYEKLQCTQIKKSLLTWKETVYKRKLLSILKGVYLSPVPGRYSVCQLLYLNRSSCKYWTNIIIQHYLWSLRIPCSSSFFSVPVPCSNSKNNEYLTNIIIKHY